MLFSFCASGFAFRNESSGVLNSFPSVRAASLQNAYSANSVTDAFSVISNPAYASDIPIISIMYGGAFENGKNISELSFASLSVLYPDLFYGINMGAGGVLGVSGDFSSRDMAAYINLSRTFGFVSFGTNVKYLRPALAYDSSSSALNADFGVLADFGPVSLGASIFNLAGNLYDASGNEIEPSVSVGAQLQANLKKGFSFAFYAGGYQEKISEFEIIPKTGLEFSYRFLSLRAGFEYDAFSSDKYSYSCGAAIRSGKWIIDYAYVAGKDGRPGFHMAALSYKVKKYVVKNERFNNQIKLEKQLAKEKGGTQEFDQNGGADKESKTDTDWNLNEFEAVLSQEKSDFIYEDNIDETEIASYTNSGANGVNSSAQHEETDFDAAKYILENPGIQKKYYQPTKHKAGDYDPALYLLNRAKKK
jgi:hypothetical protein